MNSLNSFPSLLECWGLKPHECNPKSSAALSFCTSPTSQEYIIHQIHQKAGKKIQCNFVGSASNTHSNTCFSILTSRTSTSHLFILIKLINCERKRILRASDKKFPSLQAVQDQARKRLHIKTKTNTSRLPSPKLKILQESSLSPQFPSTKTKVISLYCFFLFWSIIPMRSINPLIIHLMVVPSTDLSNKNKTSISSENPRVFIPDSRDPLYYLRSGPKLTFSTIQI